MNLMQNIFGVPLFIKKLDCDGQDVKIRKGIKSINKKLYALVKKLEKKEKHLKTQFSNLGGFHSKPLINNKLAEEFVKFVQPMVYDNLRLFHFKNDIQVTFEEPWFIINRKGHENHMHTHSGSDFSIVFYVKAPKNCGDITFYQNSYINHGCSYFNFEMTAQHALNSMSWKVTPEESMMVMFPSYLQHSVKEKLSNEERISFALNIKLKEIK